MKLISWKRLSLLMLLVLVMVSFGCSKKVAAPPPPAPAPPPPPPPPAPSITLNADRNTITAGQSVTLSYTAQNATAVTIQPGIGAVQPATSGTRQVSPTANISYTATATGPGGTANSAAVAITVNQPPPPPPPPVVRTDPPPPPPRGPSIAELFARTMTPILFDYDKYNIRPGEDSKLLNIASWLKQNPTVRFTTEGHADERGSQEYNIALGDERSAAVKKFLVGQGIAENRINTVSYGEERPICRDANEKCWQENRRAAFVMIP
jgi:peptidoglycan-associated lipoprotein